MTGIRLLDLATPFLSLLPEVELPYEKIPFDDKIVYTFIASLIYLFGQIPLIGISKNITHVRDPIYFLRGIFSCETKTLLEFGVFSPMSIALILQLLAGMRLIKVNFKLSRDRELFQTLIKVLSIFQYIILTNIFIISGYYGDNLSLFSIGLINFQVVGFGILTTLLIEVIDKGYGFGSGVMAINTVFIATNFVTDAFGITQVVVDLDGNTESQGAFINLIQNIFRSSKDSYINGITSSFSRNYLPNLTTILFMTLLAAFVCYLQNYRFELSIRSTRTRGVNNIYPIRMLYTSGLSIIFSYSLLFYIHIISFTLIQLIGSNNPSSFVVKLLGGYETNELFYQPRFPLSLLTPPKSFISGLTTQSLTFISLTLFLIITGTWFSRIWQSISGSSSWDVASQFKEQGVTLSGRREQSISKELEKIIPIASVTGAALLAVLVSVGELLGLSGKSAAIVFGVTSGFSLLEALTIDYQQSGGKSTLAQLFGSPTASF